MQTIDAQNKVVAVVFGPIYCVMQGSGPGRSVTGRRNADPLEFNAIEDIRKETDLIHGYGVSFGLIVFQDEDIPAIGDVLQIEINGLAEPVLFAIRTIAKFGIETEIIG